MDMLYVLLIPGVNDLSLRKKPHAQRATRRRLTAGTLSVKSTESFRASSIE